ncbi:tripartite tricarboxylate transporter TctB family protein [Heyndrickxia sp. NPDC080065]|uniref:tripartite tricarboxylate transporter TctB family protein n=1 Tax=Heyndrickxia sp. NPDC080065 TaxID=3390568 RepID=UPI003D077325
MLNTKNKKVSLVLIVVSVIYLILSFRLPSYAYVPVDSDVVPIALGFILLVLSIGLFFIKDSGKIAKVSKEDLVPILVVIGFILFYILFLELLGFIIVTALFIFFCSWYLGYKHFLSNSIVSLVLPIAIYLLFTAFLQVQLPSGILPF